MERGQGSASAIEEHEELAEQQTAQRERVRGIFAFMRSTRGNKRMESVNQDFNAVIHIKRCVVRMTRCADLTRSILMGQPLRLKVYKEKLKSIAGVRSLKTGRHLRVVIHLPSIIVKHFVFHRLYRRRQWTWACVPETIDCSEACGSALHQGDID